MPVQMESFQQAWANLSSPGLELTRASFDVGWEVAHLARATDKQSATPAGPGTPKPTGPDEGILAVRDLSPVQDMQARVERIGAALWYFDNHPQNQIPGGIDQSTLLSRLADLKNSVNGNGDIGSTLAAFHVEMVKSCAALDGTTTATQPNSTIVPAINGLKEAYEVGRLLAAIVLEASEARNTDAFRFSISVDAATLPRNPGSVPQKVETAAFRAYSLLGGLRGCFPSAAAYSVGRHLEDWSNWAHGEPVDSLRDFDLAEARIAILGQGKVWRAILSGQTLARDFIVATSVTDAANRLFVNWSTSATAIAKTFLRSALARFFLALGIIALLVFVGAFLVDLLTQGAATSGAKNALTISAILAAAASAAGIFHVSRTQITSVLGDIWGMIEPPMLEAELIESIALSTRRLPGDTVGGASPPQTKTMEQRLLRAQGGSLLVDQKNRKKKVAKLQSAVPRNTPDTNIVSNAGEPNGR